MNSKNKGEIGERIAIGELAKFGIDVLIPLSDNLPFDFVVYYNDKMYKCQVKTSTSSGKQSTGSTEFELTSNNWNSKKIKKYTEDEVDIFILCDLNSIYLFPFEDLKGRSSISLRNETPKNGQVKNINLASNFIINESRIGQVFR